MDKVKLGSSNIARELYKQSVPAMVGLVALALCQIMDTIFIGRWVGGAGVAAATLAAPFVLLFASIGRCLGSGGASIIGRANGAGTMTKISQTGGFLSVLCFCTALPLLGLIYLTQKPVLGALAGKDELFVLTCTYLTYLLPGLPCLSFVILANNLLRSVGRSQQAMVILLSPAIVNGVFDYLFIAHLNLGLQGAAMATTIAYMLSAIYAGICVYRLVQPNASASRAQEITPLALLKEVLGIGLAPLAAQLVSALLILLVNAQLYRLGGALDIASHGIVQRLYTFALFPLIGLCQGFLPICGYNMGAGNSKQIEDLIKKTLATGLLLAAMSSLIMAHLTPYLVALFTTDPALVTQSSYALSVIILSLPMVALQLVCSCYYQASGNGLYTILLTLVRQGAVHLPLLLLLPHFYGVKGVWYTYPLASGIGCVIAVVASSPVWKVFMSGNIFSHATGKLGVMPKRSTSSIQVN